MFKSEKSVETVTKRKKGKRIHLSYFAGFEVFHLSYQTNSVRPERRLSASSGSIVSSLCKVARLLSNTRMQSPKASDEANVVVLASRLNRHMASSVSFLVSVSTISWKGGKKEEAGKGVGRETFLSFDRVRLGVKTLCYAAPLSHRHSYLSLLFHNFRDK